MTTLAETLLQKLAKWRPDSQRQSLAIPHRETGWSAVLTADAVDEIGVRLWDVTLSRTTPLVGGKTLAERADLLADRVNGLLEPLRVVEVADVAQLRSAAPAVRAGDRFYYEVLLQSDGATSVRRYRSTPASSRREQVAFSLTHEGLAKLVTDLTSCL